MKETILRAEHLGKRFHETIVLDDVSLAVFRGDFTVVMGSSGAGKSTLLYSLSGMDAPTDGNVFLENAEITNSSEKQMAALRRQRLGFVFQKTHLVSTLTLYENVLIAALNCGRFTEAEAILETNALVERMNLQTCRERFPSAVSGGEAQRAALARAVVTKPDILFADEPTGALNRANGKEVLRLLSDLSQKGQTILMVTHDVNAALHGNRILYLEDGKIKGEQALPPYEKEDSSRKEILEAFLKAQRW